MTADPLNIEFNFDSFPQYPPPLPPTVSGAGELFDPQEKNALSQFFDHVESGDVGDNDAYGFPAFWLEQPQSYAATPVSEHGQMTTSQPYMEAQYVDGRVQEEPIPSVAQINPFEIVPHLRQPPPVHAQKAIPQTLAWGTDPLFASGMGFRAPPELPTETEVVNRVKQVLIAPHGTRTPTGKDSPELDFKPLGLDTHLSYDSNSPTSATTMTPTTARNKRRAEAGDVERKSQEPNDKIDHPPKRKKKGGGRRDNLTEEQKRENHILSEQKRRDLIRQGFTELCSLVPELREGGYSKSVVLMHAAAFLQDLKLRVEKLREYVKQLEIANGVVPA